MANIITRQLNGTLGCTLADGSSYSNGSYNSDNYTTLLSIEDQSASVNLENRHARESYLSELDNYQYRMQVGAIPPTTKPPDKPLMKVLRNPSMDDNGNLIPGVIVKVDWVPELPSFKPINS